MTKGKDLEKEYFFHENAASKHKAEIERQRQKDYDDDLKLKQLHYMKCPKCGHDLKTKRLTYIDIDQCSSCGVFVIEAQNIDKFIAEEKSLLKSLINLFKT